MMCNVQFIIYKVLPTLEPNDLEKTKGYWKSTKDVSRPLLMHYTNMQDTNPNKTER